MLAPGRLIITLRSGLPGAETLPGNLVGNSLAITAEVRDERGALVDVLGAAMLFRRPGLAVPLRVPADSLIREGVGRYRASILPDVGGTWRARFEVASPIEAAEEIRFVVPASAVVTPAQPQPVLADETGAPLLLDDGAPITVHRATTRPEASPEATDLILMGVSAEGFVQVKAKGLRDDARAAGAEGAAQGLADKADLNRLLARTPARLSRLGGSDLPYQLRYRPGVLTGWGQSNKAGAGMGGARAVDQRGAGIWAWSRLYGAPAGSQLNRCAFGVAPFNVAPGATTSTDPEAVYNNTMPHLASYVRANELLSEDRPLWINMCAQGGRPIADWDGPTARLWLAEVEQLNAMDALWQSQQAAAGVAPADRTRIEMLHVAGQQGEADDSTASANNTDDLWAGAFGRVLAQFRSLPYWTPDTTFSIGEPGRWRPFLASDGVSWLAPSNARIGAIQRVGSGVWDSSVTLVTSAGLDHALTDGDGSHFNGASLVLLGQRHGHAFAEARLGKASRHTASLAAGGGPVTTWRRLDFSQLDGKVRMGYDDAVPGFFVRCANADVALAALNPTITVRGIIHVWSASIGATIIRPPVDVQTINTEAGIEPFASLPVGFYEATWAAGSWVIRAISPRRGDYLPVALSVPTGGCLGLSASRAYDAVTQSYGGQQGLPAPQQGARFATLIRSTTGGATLFGRSFNTTALAAGGTKFAVGDSFTVGLNGMAGTGWSGRVKAVINDGEILTYEVTDWGCVMEAGTPAGPLPVVATSGAGSGATFTVSIGSHTFFATINTAVASLSYNRIGQMIVLRGIGTGWVVEDDTGLGAAGRPAAIAAEAAAITITEAQAMYGLAGYLRAAVVTLPTISAGYTASMMFRVWSMTGGASQLVAPSPGLINASSGNVDSVSLGLGLYRADWVGGRWVVRRIHEGDDEPIAEISGTFTPSLEAATPGDLALSYAAQSGFYLRHGKLISVRLTLTVTATQTTAAGPWRIAGLPAAAAGSIAPRLRLAHSTALTYGTGRSMVDALVGGTTARLRGQGSGLGDADLPISSIPSGQPVGLTLTGTYEAA